MHDHPDKSDSQEIEDATSSMGNCSTDEAAGALAIPADATVAEVLAAYRDVIDARLDRISELETNTQAFGRSCPADLRKAIRYSLLAPGKRLRPAIVLMACEACGGDYTSALPAACAVEMIHTYSLIHDDLPAMDDDDLRRGMPTNHRVFGEAMAILAGDALLAFAFQTISQVRPAEIVGDCCFALASAAGPEALVGGQVDDLAAETRGTHSPEQLEAIHARKTAAMFAVSAKLGGLVARAPDSHVTALEEYGYALGLAFQITDDLLDVQGNEDKVGKRVGKDSDRGKLTYPGLLGEDESRNRAKNWVTAACEHLLPLHDPRRLEALARTVLERDR